MTIANKLSFEKTTIRSLTDNEIDDVAGGTIPATSFYYSSSPCAAAAAAAALAAAEAARRAYEWYTRQG
jgi:hypothetical protein